MLVLHSWCPHMVRCINVRFLMTLMIHLCTQNIIRKLLWFFKVIFLFSLLFLCTFRLHYILLTELHPDFNNHLLFLLRTRGEFGFCVFLDDSLLQVSGSHTHTHTDWNSVFLEAMETGNPVQGP